MASSLARSRPKGSRSSTTRAVADRQAAAALFHALSDETRLAVLEMLGAGERCVCDLQDALDAAQSRLSFHLKVLKDAGLVTDRKEGRWSYYALNAQRLADGRAYLSLLAVPRAAGGPTLVSLARATSATRPVRRSAAAKPDDGCCG